MVTRARNSDAMGVERLKAKAIVILTQLPGSILPTQLRLPHFAKNRLQRVSFIHTMLAGLIGQRMR